MWQSICTYNTINDIPSGLLPFSGDDPEREREVLEDIVIVTTTTTIA